MFGKILGAITGALGPVGTIVGIASLLSGKKSIGEAARDAVIGSVAGKTFGLNDMFSGIFDSTAGQVAAQNIQNVSNVNKLNPKIAQRAKVMTQALGPKVPRGGLPIGVESSLVSGPIESKGIAAASEKILGNFFEKVKENPVGMLGQTLTLAGAVGAFGEDRPEAPDMSDPSMLETNPDYRGFVQNSLYDPMTGTFYGPSATLDGPVVAANQGGFIQGPGTSTSDSINAGIFQNGRKVQEAKLSDGEFVMKADAVKGLGNGDRAKGAARMYALQNQFSRMA
tara:strand:+ start:1563 stop:2408 length:846 start_codon:yes stop_codon:yes gene_type:complete